jgi:uncharacterized membrane protein YqaE (UPF0057 family)
MRDRILALYVRYVLPLRERGMGTADYVVALGVAVAILLPIVGLVLSGGIGGVGSRFKAFLDSLVFSTGP